MSVKTWKTLGVAAFDGAIVGVLTCIATMGTGGTLNWKIIGIAALTGALTSVRRFLQNPDASPDTVSLADLNSPNRK